MRTPRRPCHSRRSRRQADRGRRDTDRCWSSWRIGSTSHSSHRYPRKRVFRMRFRLAAAAPARRRRAAGRAAPRRRRVGHAADVRWRGARRHPAAHGVLRHPHRRHARARGASERGPRRGHRRGAAPDVRRRLPQGLLDHARLRRAGAAGGHQVDSGRPSRGGGQMRGRCSTAPTAPRRRLGTARRT